MAGRPMTERGTATDALDARERSEISFWTESEDERPGAFGLDLLTHKMSEARIFLEKLERYRELFAGARTILELGGGQCWPSCMVKHEVGAHARVIGTDIAPDAVVSTPQWEHVIGARIDGRAACRSNAIPCADGSVDLVFAFAAAHHFGAHRSTLREIERVLAPGGHALYLHEPGSRDWIYPLALKRVTAKRPVVPEDLLRYRHLVELATEIGLDARVEFSPTLTYRGGVETVYYLGLRKLRFLQNLLPCTVDLIFTKP
ncbi:MAG: class I SAM-dependent methyltransferase [Acidimicrobiia bacterium]